MTYLDSSKITLDLYVQARRNQGDIGDKSPVLFKNLFSK